MRRVLLVMMLGLLAGSVWAADGLSARAAVAKTFPDATSRARDGLERFLTALANGETATIEYMQRRVTFVVRGGEVFVAEPGIATAPFPPLAPFPPAASRSEEPAPASIPEVGKAGQEKVGSDGGVYVWVPPGEFMMGADDLDYRHKPIHRVRITKGFWLSKCEITNAQYAAFLNAHGSNTEAAGKELIDLQSRDCGVETQGGHYVAKTGRGDHPVVEVSWYGAKAYCDHYGLRLPTEAQWEYAARGPEGRKYPWGDEWDKRKCCNGGNRGPGSRTFPVGSFPQGASWCGALDMAGNVSEWCADWFEKYYYDKSPATDPTGPASGRYRGLRGGSWMGNVAFNYYRSACRGNDFPVNSNFGGGFRCSRTP